MADYKTIECRAEICIDAAIARQLPTVDHVVEENYLAIIRNLSMGAFIEGANSEHSELLRWRDPEFELPTPATSVLAKTKYNEHYAYSVLRYNGEHWYSIETPYNYDDDIVGWRPIWE